MKRTITVLLLIGIAVIVGCKTAQKRPKIPAPPAPPAAPTKAKASPAPALRFEAAPPDRKIYDTDFPGESGDPMVLLVKRKGSATAKTVADFHKANGVKITKFKHIQWEAVELPKGHEAKLVHEYRQSKLFERVQFQKIYKADVIPNDALFTNQWALDKIQAPLAWDKQTTNNVVVAIVDTGIDFNHPDLVNNLWTGPQGEHGYTAVNGTINNGGMDDHYHGTHVAGTVGAIGNNEIGVAGINWQTKLASFKFLKSNGTGGSFDALLCMDRMIDLKKAGQNIRVANHSWGGYGTDEALAEIFRAAEDAGILNVCAAGNESRNTDQYPFIPGGLAVDSIVTVLASHAFDDKAYFSNYGLLSTDIFAPGTTILSTKLGGGYWNLNGTSMASPHVAGAAAMLFGMNPALTPAQARTILLQPESYDKIAFTINSTDGGRLNLNKLWHNPAISNPPIPNRPPTLTTATNLVFVATNATVPISVTGSDPDGDTLAYRYSWTTYDLPSFFQSTMGGTFNGTGTVNTVSITGKSVALDQIVNIDFSATDGHGGGAGQQVSAVTFRQENKRRNIAAAIQGFQFTEDSFRLSMDSSYPEIDKVRFEIRMSGGGGGIIRKPCCYQPNVDYGKFDASLNAGTYSVRAWVCDGYGNSANSPAVQYFVSNATLRPPTVQMTVTTNRGVLPLSVTVDMSGTEPGNSTKLYYSVTPLSGSSVTLDTYNPVRHITFTNYGVFPLQFTAADEFEWIADTLIEVFTVLPPDLAINRAGSGIKLSWVAGILQEAPAVTGPWITSANQSNPQIRPATDNRFFRTVSQ